MTGLRARKPIVWVGGTKKALSGFPRSIKVKVGFALHQAELGRKHPDAKPLRGFGGAGVIEVVADHAGNTYRSVYTVKLERSVYVLHVFQKKSKHGIATPISEIKLLKERLRWAERDHENWRKGSE